VSITTRATGPDDQAASWISDPATSEAEIARRGLTGWPQLAAAMARTPKGPVLLTAITGALTDARGRGLIYGRWAPNIEAARIVMAGLLAEPELTAQHLAALAGVYVLGHEFVTAVVTHRNVDPVTVVDALWGRSAAVASAATAAGAGTLPLAVVWARRFHPDSDYRSRLRRRRIRAEVYATAARWESWAGGQQGRVEFLIGHYLEFAVESDPVAEAGLLAAGDALFAAPVKG